MGKDTKLLGDVTGRDRPGSELSGVESSVQNSRTHPDLSTTLTNSHHHLQLER